MINVKTLEHYIVGLQHVGHIVDDLDDSIRIFRKVYGLGESAVRRIPEQPEGSEATLFAFIRVGDTEFELIEARSEQARAELGASPRGGAGINHVAWRVSDIEACVRLLAAEGIRPGHVTPGGIVATGRSKIVYMDPRDTGGLLLELVEPVELPGG